MHTNHQTAVKVSPSGGDLEGAGILLIALGHPQYGNMAANAAASIRMADKDVPIHLVYHGNSISHLTPQHKALFTSMAVCPDKYITHNGQRNYLRAKTCMYALSPFTETLFLDVDLLWFGNKSITGLMQQLSAVDFTMQCRGYYDYTTGTQHGNYTHWCDVAAAQQTYSLTGNIYQLSSEVVWFRKTKQMQKYFALVRKIFDNPGVPLSLPFMGGVADELAFNIAACIMGLQPRRTPDVFFYWEQMDKKAGTAWPQVLQQYHGYSVGGNNATPAVLHNYEQMARAHAQALRLPYHFKLYPKKQWDKQRIKL